MKQLLSSILASTILLSTFSVSSAQEIAPQIPEEAGKVTTQTQTLSTSRSNSSEADFTLSETGVITGYKGSGGDVVIPSTIGGRTVTAIGANGFKGNTTVESVTIPSTVKRIESSAFSGCVNLRIVELSEGLEYIGDSAFASTTALTLIWFPSTLTELGAYAFDHSGLTSLYVPATVRNMGEYAFQNCSRLSSVIFMANVTTLPRATFYNCVVLEEVYLREGIEHIGRSAFNRCTSLQQITLPTTTKYIGEFGFYACYKLEKLDFSNTRLETVDYSAFQNCVSLTEAIFPYGFHTFVTGDNTVYTDKGQFIGCTSLKKVVLPSTVSTCFYRYTIPNFSVGLVLNLITNNYELLNHPFIDCNPSLIVYSYGASNVEKLASYTSVFSYSALSESSENKNPNLIPTTTPQLPTKDQFQVVLPVVSEQENNHATSGSEFVLSAGGVITSYTGTDSHVEIPSSIDGSVVYGIGANAFKGKTTIESVTTPRTLERLEANAFSGCSNLHTVNLNEGLQYIGVSAFASTTSLKDIWFPGTVVELGEKAFEKSGLTSLYVPETVRIMGEFVFQECTQLRSVIFMGNMDTLPRGTFYYGTSLVDVYLREGLLTIGRSAFYDCTSLREITLPSSTKNIGQVAFYRCSSLEKMDLSHTQLSVVDDYAFQECVSLTEVIFPYGFRTFTYGETSADTDRAQFKGCHSLVKVVLPSTINTLYHYYAFLNYSHLNHPFLDCHPNLEVHGYSGTSIEGLASRTSAVTFISRGDLSSEIKTLPVPTTPPTLPTAPVLTTTPNLTPEATTPSASYPAWASMFIQFVSPEIMPDISTSNYNEDSSRGLIAQSLYQMAGNGANLSATHAFTDVGDFGTAIAWCYEKGIMSGASVTEFGTESNVTREQFALILKQVATVLGKNTITGTNAHLTDFSDVTTVSSWALDGMSWAVANGLMYGSDGNLSPKGNITRTEVAVMLYSFHQL